MPTSEEILARLRQRQVTPIDERAIPLANLPGVRPPLLTRGYRPEPTQPGILEQAGDVVTGQLRTTPETAQLGEIGAQLVTPEYFTPEELLQPGEQVAPRLTTGDYLKDLKLTAGLLFSSSEEAKKDIFKEAFPDAKITKDRAGTTILTLPDGKKAVLNKPGMSFQDTLSALTDVATFYGPGKLAKIATHPLLRIGTGAVAGAATEAALEKGTQFLGSRQPVSPINVAMAGLTEGVGEVGGAFLRAIKGKKALKEIGQTAQTDIAKFLDTLAPERQVAGAAQRGRTAAQMVIEAQKELRAESASPFYKEAFKNKTLYSPRQTKNLVMEKLEDTAQGSPLDNSLKRITRFLTSKKNGARISRGLNIKQMHEVKRTIGGMIGRAFKKGDEPLAQDLLEVKNTLIDEIRGFSPNYDQARRRFAAASPNVEAMEKSIIGRVARLEDPQLKQVTSILFDPAEVGTAIPVIKETRKAIQKVDPGAWNDVVRLELEKRLSGASQTIRDIERPTGTNISAKLYQSLFGAKKKKDILYAALDTEQKKNLRYFEEGLKRSAQRGKKIMPDGIIGSASGIISNFYNLFTSPFDPARRKTRALASLVFAPQWKGAMERLRKMNPVSKKASVELTRLINRAMEEVSKPAAQAIRRQALTVEADRPQGDIPIYVRPSDKLAVNGVK